MKHGDMYSIQAGAYTTIASSQGQPTDVTLIPLLFLQRHTHKKIDSYIAPASREQWLGSFSQPINELLTNYLSCNELSCVILHGRLMMATKMTELRHDHCSES